MASSVERFAPVLKRIRRQRRIIACGLGIFFLSVFTGVLLGKGPNPFIFVGAGVGFVVLLVGIFSGPSSISCPECNGGLRRAEGNYCPECGSRSLSEGSWFYARACAACKKILSHGRGRHFKFRYCTHCGSHLNPEGF